jgi:hypothetical protein
MMLHLGLSLLLCASTAIGLEPSRVLAAAAEAGSAALLPVGTPLVIKAGSRFPMRAGAPVEGRLLYPIFEGNRLAVPAGALVRGEIIALKPDREHRRESRLRADFTPFYDPQVQFEQLTLPNGEALELHTTQTAKGAPIFEVRPPPAAKGGFFRREVSSGVEMAKSRLAVITGPDKRDRLLQFVYTQLPYHPQSIAKGTAWTVELSAPVDVPYEVEPEAVASRGGAPKQAAAGEAQDVTPSGAWVLRAFLKEDVSSSTSKPGEAIHAVVAQPVFNPDHSIAVPQGAVLEGVVTRARPARRLGRAGVLRFEFRTLVTPEKRVENVQTALTGVDAAGGSKLALDSEGNVRPKPQDKLVVPLLLYALASRPLDVDRGDNAFGKDAVASNSLGFAGFLIGTAGGWRNVAAGFGFYGTALSVYNRWIRRGAETSFGRDTRIVVQTTVRHSTPLTAPKG